MTKQQQDEIHDLYYNQKFMFGRDKVFAELQRRNSKTSRRAVMKWLSEQESHQRTTRQFQRKEIRPTLLTGAYQQLIIDLTDVQNTAVRGINYLFVAIDPFTKFVWIEPLKNKRDVTVLNGFKKIINRMPELPKVCRSDVGSEFISTIFKNYLKSKGIKQVLGQPHTPQGQGQVERLNSTLKTLIQRHILSTDKDWLKVLPQIVENINSAKHDVTKKTPKDIVKNPDLYGKDVTKRIKKQAGLRNKNSEQKSISIVIIEHATSPENQTGYQKFPVYGRSAQECHCFPVLTLTFRFRL